MKEEYTTSDINLGAFLVIRGFPLLTVEGAWGSPRRGVLHFPPEARQVAREYFNGGMVPARAYTTTLRDLKAEIRHHLHNSR